ncbi:hypothetical protein N657DRAFT_668812 [Parathielavia appendiculata]|uniref:Uncharacterized protein n=1 Tax=Parathielavia appendiculata TaxID=2587402 RepID=A0AAN6U5E1_9PEZI|nr:hypothetical protein N657DRAFT_668812 [Parathielavia appendiculata]
MTDRVDMESTVDQDSSRPSTPDIHIVSMARVMLGNSADSYGGCDEDYFVKGFEEGFKAGFSLGYRKALEEGKKQGHSEAEAEFKKRAGRESSKGGEVQLGTVAAKVCHLVHGCDKNSRLILYHPNSHPTARLTGDITLLSDVVLKDSPSSSPNCLLRDIEACPVGDDDMFHDAASSFSAQSENLLVFYAEQQLSASGSDSADNGIRIAPTEVGSCPDSPEKREEQDLLGLFDKANNQALIPSSQTSKAPEERINSSPVIASTLSVDITALVPLARPSILASISTTHAHTTITTGANAAEIQSTAKGEAHTEPMILFTIPRGDDKDPLIKLKNQGLTTLYNIPLPHTLQLPNWEPDMDPNMETSPSARRPRPPYPTLSGWHNIYALADQGRTIVGGRGMNPCFLS